MATWKNIHDLKVGDVVRVHVGKYLRDCEVLSVKMGILDKVTLKGHIPIVGLTSFLVIPPEERREEQILADEGDRLREENEVLQDKLDEVRHQCQVVKDYDTVSGTNADYEHGWLEGRRDLATLLLEKLDEKG